MTTLNELRKRIETQYLEPVNEETPAATITGDITAGALSLTITSGIFSPEEESYIAPGRPLELDSELIQVESYDQLTKALTIRRRGYRDTEAVAHTSADAELRIPTRWPRATILKTLRSSLEALWQPLYAVATEQTTIDTAKYIPLPANTVRILSVELEDKDGDWYPINAKLLPKHPLDPAVAALQPIANPYPGSLCLVSYGYQVLAPTSDDDEIVGLPSKWERIVLADAASELLAGVDIDAQTQERLTEQIRIEGFPVRSGASISQNLIRFADFLVEKANRELTASYPRKVRRVRTSLFGSGG